VIPGWSGHCLNVRRRAAGGCRGDAFSPRREPGGNIREPRREDIMRSLLTTLAGCLILLPGRIAAQADSHPTLTVGSATARRGEKVYGAIQVPAGTDSGYAIPVVLVHGSRPGPVLALVSGAHGTEY